MAIFHTLQQWDPGRWGPGSFIVLNNDHIQSFYEQVSSNNTSKKWVVVTMVSGQVLNVNYTMKEFKRGIGLETIAN